MACRQTKELYSKISMTHNRANKEMTIESIHPEEGSVQQGQILGMVLLFRLGCALLRTTGPLTPEQRGKVS